MAGSPLKGHVNWINLKLSTNFFLIQEMMQEFKKNINHSHPKVHVDVSADPTSLKTECIYIT